MKKVLMILLLVGGCCWRSPNAEFYMMKTPQETPLSTRKMVVAVADIKVPDLLNRQQMVIYDKDSNQVNIMEFNRWAEIFPDVVQGAIVNDLMALLPDAYIKRSNFDSNRDDYNINVEINQMITSGDVGARLSVWWNVVNAKGKILLREQKVYEAGAESNNIQDLVQAQNDVVNQLAKDIASHLIKL